MQSPSSKEPPRVRKSRIKKASSNAEITPVSPSSLSTSSTYILTFILLISTLLIYDLITVSDETVDLQAVTTDLVNSVHNQSEAVNCVIESLNLFQNQDQSMNIHFVGSNGVGKTFVANILKKHFLSVYESRGAVTISGLEELLSKFIRTSTKYNLIVIDDLTVKDIDNLMFFMGRIPQETVVFVICIFNNQETDDNLNYNINEDHVREITREFVVAEIPYQIARFHEFTKDQVRDWINKQLITKQLDPHVHSQVVESLLKHQNIKYQGLKGLSSKLNVVL